MERLSAWMEVDGGGLDLARSGGGSGFNAAVVTRRRNRDGDEWKRCGDARRNLRRCQLHLALVVAVKSGPVATAVLGSLRWWRCLEWERKGCTWGVAASFIGSRKERMQH